MIDPNNKYLRAMLPPPKANRTGRDADPRRTIPLNSAQWQNLRATVINEEPLCRYCSAQGWIVSATDVDHISGDPSDNRRENLQSLCHECHSKKTAADHGKAVSWGCDVNGMPLDPAHPWNKEKSLGRNGDRPPGSSLFNPKSYNQDTEVDRK
ncbi:HNH endonuclease [Pusillimonas sp. TS35]|nr:HNH endonuclease [Pusillimonas sp. TS35]